MSTGRWRRTSTHSLEAGGQGESTVRPNTGESTPEFRRRFVERRRETFPEWADEDAFGHHYTLMIITRIPESDRVAILRVGDTVTTLE